MVKRLLRLNLHNSISSWTLPVFAEKCFWFLNLINEKYMYTITSMDLNRLYHLALFKKCFLISKLQKDVKVLLSGAIAFYSETKECYVDAPSSYPGQDFARASYGKPQGDTLYLGTSLLPSNDLWCFRLHVPVSLVLIQYCRISLYRVCCVSHKLK